MQANLPIKNGDLAELQHNIYISMIIQASTTFTSNMEDRWQNFFDIKQTQLLHHEKVRAMDTYTTHSSIHKFVKNSTEEWYQLGLYIHKGSISVQQIFFMTEGRDKDFKSLFNLQRTAPAVWDPSWVHYIQMDKKNASPCNCTPVSWLLQNSRNGWFIMPTEIIIQVLQSEKDAIPY